MLALALASCAPSYAADGPRVKRLGKHNLPQGIGADARPGDVALLASGARFIVSDLDHAVGLHSSGGSLIDVEIDGVDLLGGVVPWLAREFPRQPLHQRMKLGRDSVTVSGPDSGDASVHVETTWALLEDAPREGLLGRLEITTTAHNRGTSTRAGYALGDIVGWGPMRAFGPGPGYDLSGQDTALPWIGAQGEGQAMLITHDGGLSGPHGSGWSDPVYETHRLEPGAQATTTRQLWVGRSLSDLLAAAARRGYAPDLSVLPGRVLERGSGRPVAGARVAVRRAGGEPALVGRSDEQGEFSLALAPGEYRLSADAPDRRALPARKLTVQAGDAAHRLTKVGVSPQGFVELGARDPDGRPVPARFDIKGLDGTPDPDLGPAHRARAGNRLYLARPTRLTLPPGSYRVVATRGPAWSIAEGRLDVPEGGAPAVFDARLRRVLDTEGWLQCDLHQHTRRSFDSSIPLADSIIASTAEGLDCFASTDHDVVGDMSAAIAQVGPPQPFVWLPGVEVTTASQGHFNLFPWDPELGPLKHQGLLASEVVAAARARAPGALVQINHPRGGDIGLFDLLQLDPTTGEFAPELAVSQDLETLWSTDLIEIVSGRHPGAWDRAFRDWLGLLAAGHRLTPVGNSDSHNLLTAPRGSPRTWVRVGHEASARGVTAALRSGEGVVASTGPMLELRPEGGGLRLRAQAPDWMSVGPVDVYFGPYPEEPRWRSVQLGAPPWPEADGAQRLDLLVVPPEAPPPGSLAVAVLRGGGHMAPWSELPPFAIVGPVELPSP